MIGDNWFAFIFFGITGLIIGSFLNVVILRLPKMMEMRWDKEKNEELIVGIGQNIACINATKSSITYNLWVPRSSCPFCEYSIRWYENIPIISWLLLRGRCSNCNEKISIRYPLVELTTAGLFIFCSLYGGIESLTAWAFCSFTAALLCLAFIDFDTTLLPDDITIPLIWAGLICASINITNISSANAIAGAVCGYISLWSVYWIFKLCTGKEGIGFGDFKLFSALGAWLGWEPLIPIILFASIVGAIIGIYLNFRKHNSKIIYIPFGPFLVSGTYLYLLYRAIVGIGRDF